MSVNEDMLSNYGGFDQNSLNNIIAPDGHINEDDNDDLYDLIRHSFYYSDKQIVSHLKERRHNFSILSMNVASLNAKFDQIKIYVELLKAHNCELSIICLQESWLSDISETSLFQLDRYTMLSQGKICSGHGGLVIYVSNRFHYKHLSLYKRSDVWEGQFIEISGSQLERNIITGNIYRPPRDVNTNYHTFIEEMNPIFEILNNKNCECIILGDFNIDLLKTNERPIFSEYLDNIISHNFFPKITLPTRFSFKRGTLIDNALCKCTSNISDATAGIVSHTLSDHHPYFITLKSIRAPLEKTKFIYKKSCDSVSVQKFVDAVAEANIYNLINLNPVDDPNHNYNIISDTLQDTYEKHLPVKKVRYNKHKHKNTKWITAGIMRSIQFRDNLNYRLKITPSNTILYQTIKNNISNYNKILQKLIRNAKKTYYYSCFTKYKHDLKNTWITIKDILNKQNKNKHNFPEHFQIDGNNVSDKETIANKFNIFFSKIGPNVAKNIVNIEQGSFKNYLNNPCSDTFSFKTIEEAAVIKVIDNLSSKNSCGIDKITTKLLKIITPYITKSITFIINQSLSSGVCPDKLKIAKIVPIYKNKSTLDNSPPPNYDKESKDECHHVNNNPRYKWYVKPAAFQVIAPTRSNYGCKINVKNRNKSTILIFLPAIIELVQELLIRNMHNKLEEDTCENVEVIAPTRSNY